MRQLAEPAQRAEPLGPKSLVWQLGFSRTGLLYAGRALLLQVAHPVVGAGVRDFSAFREDPWGRLDRTLDSLLIQLFGGARAYDEAARLRALHRTINGTGFDGERYTALQPEAWAWVHLSNFDTASHYVEEMVRPLTRDERERHYAEWRQLGLVLGIKSAHMPAAFDDVAGYVDEMVHDRLSANPTTAEVLASLELREVAAPPHFPTALWTAMKPLGRTVLRDFTVGTLPAALRERMGLAWTAADERRLDRLRTLVRTASRAIPDRLLHYPLGYRAKVAATAAGRFR